MNKPNNVFCTFDEMAAISALREHPSNDNKHPQTQIDLYARILAEIGVRAPIIVSRLSGFIVAGHGALYAARLLRWTHYPVNYQDFTSEAEELAHLSAANQLARLSRSDEASTGALLARLQASKFDLSLTGYDAKSINRILSKLRPELPGGDAATSTAAEKLREKWCTALGQVWALGSHRIICGDATDPDVFTRLMRGGLAQLTFTDPPYGISYEDGDGTSILNDTLTHDALSGLLVPVLRHCVAHTAQEAAFYIFHASSTRRDFEWAMNTAGLRERQYLTWIKEGFVLGRSHYQWQTEHCFYAEKDGRSAAWFGDRAQPTVWRLQAHESGRETPYALGAGVFITNGSGDSLFVRERKPKADKARHVRLAEGASLRLLGSASTSAWEVKRDPPAEYLHPTQKPVELPARAVNNSTRPGDVVLDPFSGSGSTLLACEQTGRTARVVELDPKFVAVAIERWAAATGGVPALAEE